MFRQNDSNELTHQLEISALIGILHWDLPELLLLTHKHAHNQFSVA